VQIRLALITIAATGLAFPGWADDMRALPIGLTEMGQAGYSGGFRTDVDITAPLAQCPLLFGTCRFSIRLPDGRMQTLIQEMRPIPTGFAFSRRTINGELIAEGEVHLKNGRLDRVIRVPSE